MRTSRRRLYTPAGENENENENEDDFFIRIPEVSKGVKCCYCKCIDFALT